MRWPNIAKILQYNGLSSRNAKILKRIGITDSLTRLPTVPQTAWDKAKLTAWERQQGRGKLSGGGGRPAKSFGIDLYPQFISGDLILSSANTFTTERISMPISRMARTGKTITVMELIRFEMVTSVLDFVGNADQAAWGLTVGLAPTANVGLNDPRAVSFNVLDWIFSLTTSGAAGVLYTQPYFYNFQDTNGFGFLLATDFLNVWGNTTQMAAAANFQWRLFYRFVDVKLPEFIGILQSQSQQN